MNVFVLTAYERYRKVLHPLKAVKPRILYPLYGASWAAAALATAVAWATAHEGTAVQPSGLYCNLDFAVAGNFGVFVVFIAIPLVWCAWAYTMIYFHLKSLGDDRVGDNRTSRRESTIAMKVTHNMHALKDVR